jgi:hypothetical protein
MDAAAALLWTDAGAALGKCDPNSDLVTSALEPTTVRPATTDTAAVVGSPGAAVSQQPRPSPSTEGFSRPPASLMGSLATLLMG